MDKIVRLAFAYVKCWYIGLVIFAILSIAGTIYLSFWYPDKSKVGILFFNSLFILVNSILYLKITTTVSKVFTSNNLELFKSYRNLAGYFLILFFLDLISVVRGGFHNHHKDAANLILELLPQDGSVYSIYSKVYLYLPAAFEFLLPRIEGSILLVISIILSALAKQENGFIKIRA